MRVFVLDGSAHGDTLCAAALSGLHAVLRAIGCEPEVLAPRDVSLNPCTGCFGCWTHSPGVCLQDDAGREVIRRAICSDLLVFLTPVTFGGYSSLLKRAVDRLIPLLSPRFTRVGRETHHQRRYQSYPRLVAVGVMAHPDQESEQLFRTLVGRNAINLHSPSHAAAVLAGAMDMDGIRARLRALLSEVGVK